jgi:hypothetical protein
MASQVFSGTNNFSYTNNTGQNARVIINYMTARLSTNNVPLISFSWGGVSGSMSIAFPSTLNADLRKFFTFTIGKNLAFRNVLNPGSLNISTKQNNLYSNIDDLVFSDGSVGQILYPISGSLPTEILLSSNQTFSAVCGSYNILVIPEAG